MNCEKVDVAINSFAKPFQLALSLLSLLKCCEQHINTIWIQFEAFGSKHDKISPYLIVEYLEKQYKDRFKIFQPKFWIANKSINVEKTQYEDYRLSIRYQYAFENCTSRLLFLMHNDVFILKDILGDMIPKIEDYFAIGEIGQCWNCPANKTELTKEILQKEPCISETYDSFIPNYNELCELYQKAKEKNIFVRDYDKGFKDLFYDQPWPLPECRVNEWALLLNLEKTKPHIIPFGNIIPLGAFLKCGGDRILLDTGVAWFRGMHKKGFKAHHFPIRQYIKHWVGTGNKTPKKYIWSETNALNLLKKHFPHYINWLKTKCPQEIY